MLQLKRRCGPLSAEQESVIRSLPLHRLETLAEARLDVEGIADLNACARRPPCFCCACGPGGDCWRPSLCGRVLKSAAGLRQVSVLSACCLLPAACCLLPFSIMTSADRNDLMPTQEKLEWVTPKISLMDAGETSGSKAKQFCDEDARNTHNGQPQCYSDTQHGPS
jgi:hypothetical protein